MNNLSLFEFTKVSQAICEIDWAFQPLYVMGPVGSELHNNSIELAKTKITENYDLLIRNLSYINPGIGWENMMQILMHNPSSENYESFVKIYEDIIQKRQGIKTLKAIKTLKDIIFVAKFCEVSPNFTKNKFIEIAEIINDLKVYFKDKETFSLYEGLNLEQIAELIQESLNKDDAEPLDGIAHYIYNFSEGDSSNKSSNSIKHEYDLWGVRNSILEAIQSNKIGNALSILTRLCDTIIPSKLTQTILFNRQLIEIDQLFLKDLITSDIRNVKYSKLSAGILALTDEIFNELKSK